MKGNLVYFAGFRKHFGFDPVPTGISKFSKGLSDYKQGRGSVQFPFDKPIPYGLISRIVKFRSELAGDAPEYFASLRRLGWSPKITRPLEIPRRCHVESILRSRGYAMLTAIEAYKKIYGNLPRTHGDAVDPIEDDVLWEYAVEDSRYVLISQENKSLQSTSASIRDNSQIRKDEDFTCRPKARQAVALTPGTGAPV